MFGIGMIIPIIVLLVIVLGGGATVIMKKKQNADGTSRFFSSLTEKLSMAVRRFPVSIVCVMGFAILLFEAINGEFDDIPYKLWFFFSCGAVIGITATLCAEDFFNRIKTYGAVLLALALWGVYCLLLPAQPDDIQISKGIEIVALGILFCAAMFFIPFLKKNTDRQFWNFATQTLSQLAFACIFGAIIFGGLSLAVFALDNLFNTPINGKVYGNLAAVCFALFAPVYFLANIPSKEAKHSDELFYTKIQKILALYVLTPILAIYALILYAYLCKIIAVWELPNGWVSWLVSALALGGLLVITLLFPVREQERNKVVQFISRWFGLLILPLLALMTIGITRRIGDYGITIHRGYVLLANLWFYGIYVYLFISQSRHIKWILISLVGVALVTSMSAWGVAEFTKKSLTREVAAVLNKQISTEEARAQFAQMTQSEKDRMRSALEYLHRNFGKESVQPFFADSVSDGYWSWLSELGLSEAFVEPSEWISYYAKDDKVWNVEGYNAFTKIDYVNYKRADDANYSFENDTIKITLNNRTFSLPAREIALKYATTDKSLRDKQEWRVQENDYTIVIRYFRGNYYPAKDSVDIGSLDGYLFYK